MSELSENIKGIEAQIEKALYDLELHDQLEKALSVYQDAEMKLGQLPISQGHRVYADQQRVLSYCLMRQGNILRQMEKPQDALLLGEREMATARASGDEITLGRSLMSNGTNLIVSGETERGMKLIEEAQKVFEKGDSVDYKQGLGWCLILQADLANAGLYDKESTKIIEMATNALGILTPIENWPGVARAYAARAKAHERLGDFKEAEKDLQAQKSSENKIEPGKEGDS